MASHGVRLGVGFRARPATCTPLPHNSKCTNTTCTTQNCKDSTQDRRPAWRLTERYSFILRSNIGNPDPHNHRQYGKNTNNVSIRRLPTISNTHRHQNCLSRTLTSSPRSLLRRKPSNDEIRKRNQRLNHKVIPSHSIARLIACLHANNAPSPRTDPSQSCEGNNDSHTIQRVAKDQNDPLLCIQNLHNPCIHTYCYLSDIARDEAYLLSPFEAYMLSTELPIPAKSLAPHQHISTKTSTSNTASTAKTSQSDKAVMSQSTPRQTAIKCAKNINQNNIVSLNESLRTLNYGPKPDTTTQRIAEIALPIPNRKPRKSTIDYLAQNFSNLSLQNPAKKEVDHINEGHWPWAPRATSLIDVSEARYHANLLTLLKDFALKARHKYAITKQWPPHETEVSALRLAAKAEGLFARGVREREEYGEEGNYLEELDWYWRYWGEQRRAYQRVWDYVVRGDIGKKATAYSAGLTRNSLRQKEWQKGVEF